MNHLKEPDRIRTKVLTENTAQGVLNHLKALESNRARMLTRWIWELLQNARDTSATFASIERGQGEVIFRHDGTKFKMHEIAHLIYHGSTKVEDGETIGQYGSGFLTTHLLSPTIDVSGQLDDGRSFKFSLRREVGSVQELSDSMEQAWNDFNNSLPVASPPNGFTTRFRYPGEDAAKAAKDGLAALKRCAPFVVVFNKAFSRININSSDETTSFRVTERVPLAQDGLQEITVSENENGSRKDRIYLLAEGAETAVAVPLGPTGDGNRALLLINDTPRLFLGFPLIGTEKFSFPAVINSFVFTPTEDRDGLYLWRNDDEANRENQTAMGEACKLLIRLIQFAAESGWSNIYALANVSALRGDPTWLDPDSLRALLEEQLIERIRKTPAVLCRLGAISPEDSVLPLTETGTGVENLWDLLDGLEEFRQKLPRQNEAVGWCNTIRSWMTVCKCQPTSFEEAFDGRKLAEHVEKKTKNAGEDYGCLENLQKLLREDVSAVEWLNRLYQFLKDDGLKEVIHTQSIILDQGGCLNRLSNLHRDQDIAEELKDIAKLLGWDIRLELRDKRIPSLANEVGAGNRDSEYVVGEIIKKLQERAENNPDDDFGKASLSLFTWIVGQENLNLLRGFPVFTKEGSVGGLTVVYLPRAAQDSDRLLAPVSAWPEDLRPFDDLFPQNRILADTFFEAVPDPETWRILDEQGFIRTNVVVRGEVSSDTEFSDRTFRLKGPLSGDGDTKHRTVDCITVTDIAFLTDGIMTRVRQSPRRAYLFWRFLTEWLVKEDVQGLEVKESQCACESTHQHFQAAWLVQVGENRWIRRGDTYFQATAQSLANLLRDNGWNPGSLNENPAAVELLKAIGVTRFDLMRALASKSDKERAAMDDQLTYLITATGGDLSHVREFVEDLENDKELPTFLKKRREDVQMARKNQHLGQLGEELMKKSLEDKGFTVTRTGTGSDYEIKLSSGDQSWLVEVKSTQGQAVRMSDTQARKAVEKEDGFLLCVVPVESETPALDEVRDKMRFVENIDSLVEPLCNGLDEFEDLRKEIMDDKSSGVQLVVEAGTARVRVDKSVWDKGFRLEDLSKKLK